MSEDPHKIELPEPTAWPVVAAFGLCLVFAGMVTSIFVSLVGLLVGLAGAVGWFLDVFPHPKHEYVDTSLPAHKPAPVEPSRSRVEHLHMGEQGHRLPVPEEVHPYTSGIKGGLAGALVMALMACGWGLFKYGSIWYPINLLAAAGLPELAVAGVDTLRQFSMGGLIVGVGSHLTISVLVGLLYVVLLPMLPAKFEWFWGGIVTPAIWSVLVVFSMPLLNPSLAKHVDWPWFIACQIAFGVVAGYVVFKSARIETMHSLPLAAKLGVEAQEKE